LHYNLAHCRWYGEAAVAARAGGGRERSMRKLPKHGKHKQHHSAACLLFNQHTRPIVVILTLTVSISGNK